MYHEIITIGGGASGIMASITAKDMGKDIAIIEGTDRIGKKILATGNGRCNITNKFTSPSKYHSSNKDFFDNILNSFTVKDTENFFSFLGLPLVELESGKMYPMSLQASSVLDILRIAIEERDLPLYLNNKVKNIKKTKKGYRIQTSTDVFECKKLIIACGGMSSPKTGSDGSGFTLAKSLNHSIIKPKPALVQLKLDFKSLKALSGVKFDGNIEIHVNEKLIRKEFGEILFTNYGISGPPILQLSSIASDAALAQKECSIHVDMMPTLSKDEVEEFLENHWGTFSYRSVYDSFIGIINKKIIPILLKNSGIVDIHKPCYDLDWHEKQSILSHLKDWQFKVIGTNSFGNSQVTSGGINTKEVSSKTLESKKNKNLYLCGEILDVFGDCGGYNLQWAWASGYVAGINASKDK